MNLSALRQVVAGLRSLMWQARDAGSPTSATVITMAAGAMQDIASIGRENDGPGATARKLRGE